ncbi:MAG: MGMT family protein [Firmicutes bacterium]|nr:MGMT family protein [Bacillota bacterium]
MTEFERAVYEAVKLIPEGKTATYGQIAELAGHPRAARAVGNALHRNPDETNVHCHRVVNADGRLARNFGFGGQDEQRRRLIADGVYVVNCRVDLEEYGINVNELKQIAAEGSDSAFSDRRT